MIHFGASQVVLVVKSPPGNADRLRDAGLIPGSGRSPGGGHGNLLWYTCLENPHGERSLACYSQKGQKELDMTEWLSTDSTAMTTMLDSTGLGRVGRTWRAQEEKKKKSKVINISSSCLRTVICCYVILSHTTQRMLWQLPKTYTNSNQFLWKLNNLCSELNAVSGTQPTLNKCWLLLVAF